jgi:3-methylcrotonyl-CoA carboxylase beta subunit
MDVLQTKIAPADALFKANAAHMQNHLDALRQRLLNVKQGGGEKSVQRHRQRGKLFVRDRIESLIDPDSPFLEFSSLAANGMYDDAAPGAGVVTGIGRVQGRLCVLVANDATVKGGTYFPMTVKKHLRAQEIALENHLPCIYLVDSGGAFLPMQDEVFPDRDHFGRIFYNQARMSAKAIPQIAVVMGSCTAGGAYVPAMSDESVIVKEQGTIFLGGPPLVKAATGEEVSAEDLGGADVHCRTSGVPTITPSTTRTRWPSRATSSSTSTSSRPRTCARCRRRIRCTSAEEIYGIVNKDIRKPYDVREIIARIVDGSASTNSRNCTARRSSPASRTSGAIPVGILANNGVLFSESALKAAHFIELCSSAACRWSSCRTSPASWSGGRTSTAASPRTARRWWRRSPTPACPSSRW